LKLIKFLNITDQVISTRFLDYHSISLNSYVIFIKCVLTHKWLVV